MSDDLIKRSDAIEVAYQLRRKPNDEEWDWWLRSFNAIPPIDIVFCKECKFSEVIQNDSSGVMARYCRAFTVPMMKSDDDFCSYGWRDSEKPNNCEHITEDGVTCARYPACDDCPDNPLNKVKGSERLVKGSEVTTDCKTCKYGQDKHRYAHICNECGVGINNYTPQTERSE